MNLELFEKLYLPDNFKLVDINPVYSTLKDSTLVVSYRPVSVLPTVSKNF